MTRARLVAVSVRRGVTDVIAGVDLALPLDRRVVVLGPNGAGKTTLLRLVQGLERPDQGRVAFETARRADASANVPADAPLEGRAVPAPRLAYVFQKPVMLRRSAAANIEHALALAGVPAAGREGAARAALARVGLEHVAERPARRLSGGEQQRLALARASALDPVALLLDEPTASLDPGAAAAIERELMRLACAGIGFVMATHDLPMARRVATDIVFMHRGRVLETGPAARCFDEPRTPEWQRFLAGEWLE
jgi:tungstate transport system ATP-binding protein